MFWVMSADAIALWSTLPLSNFTETIVEPVAYAPHLLHDPKEFPLQGPVLLKSVAEIGQSCALESKWFGLG